MPDSSHWTATRNQQDSRPPDSSYSLVNSATIFTLFATTDDQLSIKPILERGKAKLERAKDLPRRGRKNPVRSVHALAAVSKQLRVEYHEALWRYVLDHDISFRIVNLDFGKVMDLCRLCSESERQRFLANKRVIYAKVVVTRASRCPSSGANVGPVAGFQRREGDHDRNGGSEDLSASRALG